MRPLGTVGLALASNVAVVVQAVYLQARLGRSRASLGFGPLLATVGKVVLASLLMGAVVAAGWQFWVRAAGRGGWWDAGALVLLIPAGVALYAGVLWALRIEGREELRALLLRKVRPGTNR
jgi:putative peptidoglycan lipid II flippase